MKWRIHFALSCLLLLANNVEANVLSLESAKAVLDKLYKTNGNQIFIKPEIRISDREFAVAQYLARENVIILERKLLSLCADFGADSLNALAFVLGHELIHCNSIHSKKKDFQSSFLARSHEHSTTDEEERLADVQGLFTCWLAEFNTIEIVPKLLQRIYKSYGLNNKLHGYPDLEERMQASKQLVDQVRIMIQIFENANYLMAANEFELARASLLYIENYYQGREIYNNLAATYLMEVLSTQSASDFIYPIEIDLNTKLTQLQTQRGEQNAQAIAYRKECLLKANEYLDKALQLSYNYFTAELNLMCTKALLGDYNAVVARFKENELAKRKLMGIINGREFNQGRAILAIALLKLKEQKEALTVLNKILRYSADSVLVQQARCNKELSLNRLCFSEFAANCSGTVGTKNIIDGMKLHRQPYLGTTIQLSEKRFELSVREQPNSIVYVYSKSKQVMFTLQKVVKPESTKLINSNLGNKAITTKSGNLWHCKDNKIIYRLDAKDSRIKELAHYYSNRI